MALELKIKYCNSNNCKSLQIYDSTEEYNVSTNTTGWGTPNSDPSLVSEATITLLTDTTKDAQSIQNIDVLTSVPASVTGEFLLGEFDFSDLEDGEYVIKYTIVDGSSIEYSITKSIYITCKSRCCIDKMWIRYIKDLSVNGCGCDCQQLVTGSLLNDALFGEALLKSLKMSAASLDDNTRDKIKELLDKLCQFQNCNC